MTVTMSVTVTRWCHRLLGLASITGGLLGGVIARDIIHLESGAALQGAIDRVDHGEGRVRFKVIMEGPRGRGEALRQVSMKDIAFIDFAQSELEIDVAAGRAGVEVSLAAMRHLWKRHETNLHLANCPGGAIGLACIGRLLATGRPSQALEAEEMAGEIVHRDWDAERRRRAACYRLQAMVLAGRVSEARAEAALFLDRADDPALAVEARLVLGHAAFHRLGELVAQHPRWMDDREIRPQCESLIRSALDHFLFASLFHGALREPAAEGLWQACRVYRLINKPERARAVARDLTELYPAAKACQRARDYLEIEGEARE